MRLLFTILTVPTGIPAHRLLGGAGRNVIQLNRWIGIVEAEAAVRASAPDMEIRVDANEGQRAPIDRRSGDGGRGDRRARHARIRPEAADLVKVKVMKQGGLFRCLQAIDTAVTAGMQCVVGHGFGLTLNMLAELHVASMSESILEACESVGPAKVDGDVVTTPLRFETAV